MTRGATNIITISHFTVQPDYPQDIADVALGKATTASFWLSLYNYNGRQSIHAEVSVLRKSQTDSVALSCDSDVSVEFINGNSFALHHSNGSRTVFQAPGNSYRLSKSLNALNVSPAGELIIVGGDDGALHIVDAHDGSIRRTLEGHLSDITAARFFPSGQVILSGSRDMQVKIWGLDGNSPVTLKGHSGGITDIAVIGRGRNVLTCARDGVVRLWECGSASTIGVISPGAGPINQMSLAHGTIHTQDEGSEPDAREVETENKLLFLVTENGSLLGYQLRTKAQVLSVQSVSGSSLTAVSYCPELAIVAVGSRDGVVEVYDINKPSIPLTAFRRNATAITHVRVLRTSSTGSSMDIIFANEEGSCTRCRFSISSTNEEYIVPQIIAEYAGVDVEPLNGFDMRIDSNGVQEIFTGGREGIIRKYRCP